MSENLSDLTKAFLKLRTAEEINDFLQDLFSPKELENISGRWQAVKLLSDRQSYLDIQKQTGLSSATIAKMSQSFKYGHGIFAKVIERMRN